MNKIPNRQAICDVLMEKQRKTKTLLFYAVIPGAALP